MDGVRRVGVLPGRERVFLVVEGEGRGRRDADGDGGGSGLVAEAHRYGVVETGRGMCGFLVVLKVGGWWKDGWVGR